MEVLNLCSHTAEGHRPYSKGCTTTWHSYYMILAVKTLICTLKQILPSSYLKVTRANPAVGFFRQPGPATDLKRLNSFKWDKLKFKKGLKYPHPLW